LAVREQAAPTAEDQLVELAALIEPDGGMPGKDYSDRLLRTLIALLAFASMGYGRFSGPFRVHLERMFGFVELQLTRPLSEQQIEAGKRAVKMLKAEEEVKGPWVEIAARTLLHGGRTDWTALLNRL
jgi:hypothetical protein